MDQAAPQKIESMNDDQRLEAISVNLLRIAQWYYLDPQGSQPLCERYLVQSKKLAEGITTSSAQVNLDKLSKITFDDPDSHLAERFLTLGVLLHQAAHHAVQPPSTIKLAPVI